MKNILTIFFFIILSSCASITGTSTQPISIVVKDGSDNSLEDVKCTLVNDKGAWEIKAPAFANVTRSAADLAITCKKKGYPDGLAKGVSRAIGNMWGNVILGGGVGAIIDHSKGKGYGYSDQMTIIMGKTTLYDRKTGSNLQSTY